MKFTDYFLILLTIALNGCTDNPSDSNTSTILSASKTVVNDYVFHRDSIFNTDTLAVSLETSSPDIYIYINFYLAQRFINSTSTTILQQDSAITSSTFSVRPDYTEISWITAYEVNNMGWEIQRKDSSGMYTSIGFVNGSGNSNETHSYSYTHNIEPSSLFFYRFKQIHFDGSFKYALEAKIEVEATDSIKAGYSITADNGVIIYNGEIAPDSGYTYNLPFMLNDLIYFRNSLSHYGKIRILSFNFLSAHYLNIDEFYKNISYNLSYEVFLQTNGTRTFF
jgi:hypothetical protein